MPLTRIRQTAIGNDSITSAKLAHDLDLDGDFVRVPHGTTAERPSSPAAGYMRFNTDQGTLEQWNTTTNSWQAIDSPPIITSLAYSGSLTAADPAGGETITLTGTNFKSGATVTVGGTSASSVSLVNSTTITFTTPVKTAGDYDAVVINSNGLQATLTNGISYNGTPAFTTAAGNVGSVQEDVAMSTITIVAAEPDGGTLAYSVTSGALPTGVSLGSANGQLTGTPNANITSDTTFNFTVTATDDENQTNSRAFNLIVLRPIYATQISNSLRFNDDDGSYLSRTPSSNGNRKTWTWSAWIKRANIGALTQVLLEATDSGGSSVRATNRFASDTLNGSDSSTGLSYTTNRVFRDPSAWYHILIAMDTTQSTDSNRFKLYINGVQETSFSSITWPTLNADSLYNSTSYFNYLGATRPAFSQYFDGYMSDVHFIDGQALTPTSFAEEHNGVWAPKDYSGSYGTNGFHLDFADNSAIGNDVSGNNNDWTATNFGTFDVFPDSPTINFCTLNPLIKRRDVSNNVTFYQGNLGAVYPDAGGNQTYSFGTHGMSSGKWYYEVYMFATGSNTTVGIGRQSDADAVGGGLVVYKNDGAVSTAAGGSKDGDGASYANGDVIGCGFDLDNGTVTFYKNGTLQSTVTGISTTETYMPFVRGTTSEQILTNFGQDSTFSGTISAASNADGNGIGNFKYTVPSGHLAICSKNLSESAINTSLDDRPEDYMTTALWTHDVNNPASGEKSINLGFRPDLVWSKNRDNAEHHYLMDSVRGNAGDKFLALPFTGAEQGEQSVNNTGAYYDFTSTGFDIIDDNSAVGEIYYTNRTYVGWTWKASGAPTATNSAGAGNVPTSGSVMIDGVASTSALAGTIAADKISANTKSGFSIVNWAGNTTSGATVAHGLNSAPEFIIFKRRDGVSDWHTYHKDTGNAALLYLNTTAGPGTSSAFLNNTTPSNTVVTLGNSSGTNGSDMIMYCWHSIPGYSKIGFYQSSGFADGVFVELGFKPAWILIKSTSAGRNWTIWDNTRGHASSVGAGNNPNTTTLFVNTAGVETHNTGYAVDFTANGFKTRGQGGEINTTNEKMTFMAFAEDPFKYAEAR